MQTNPVRLGFILGLFLAFWHACWAGLVASGFAQPVIDFVFWAHFLNSPFAIQPFEPLRALAILVMMFSLAGVPPMLGFFAKFNVLRAAYDAGLVWLAVAGVIASVIGAFYYLRIVYFMYFGDEEDGLDGKMTPALWFAAMLAELGHELVVGDAAKIRAMEPRKQKHDRRDAEHLLNLLVLLGP